MTTVNDFYEMRVLVTVVEAGSFTSAAQSLGLPKSSVSRRVSALEERLGVRLLHRSTRSLSLTDVGLTYYEKATRLLCELQDLEANVQGYAQEPVGRLRVTCPTGFLSTNSNFFAKFSRTYSSINLRVEESARMVDLVSEGFDLAFRGGKEPGLSMSGQKLHSSRFIMVASQEYLRDREAPQGPKDLSSHHIVLLSSHTRGSWRLRRGRQSVDVHLVGRVSVNTLGAVYSLAYSGLGIAMLPEGSCAKALQSQELVHLLPDWEGGEAELWLVYPTERQMSSGVRAFVQAAESYDFDIL